MTRQPVGVRLAIRREGEWIKAYFADTDTLEGARLIGTIEASITDHSEVIWQAWKQVMSDILSLAVQEIVGVVPHMVEEKAPEHEKAGSA